MASFSQLFRRVWGVIFYSSKSFWTIFILSNVVNCGVFGSLYVMGYNPMNQSDVLRMMTEVWPYVFLMVGSIVLGIIFSFFTYQYVSQIFLGKGTSFQITLVSWRRILSAIGTYICGVLLGLGIYIVLFIGIGLGFGIGVLWFLLVNQISGTWHLVLLIIGVLGAIGYMTFLCCVFFWSIVVFFTFPFPAFFLDNVRYFDAMILSMKIIRKRWWRTFGMICLASLCAMIIIVPLSLISSSFVLEGALSVGVLILISAVQSIVGIYLMTFIFALYEDYKKHPISGINKKEVVLPKKKVVRKRVSKNMTK